VLFFFFFFNDTATTEIYTLSLHDALPIWGASAEENGGLVYTFKAGRHEPFNVFFRWFSKHN